MPSLAQIRAALVTTIGTAVEDLTGYPNVPETINVPAFLVEPQASNFVTAMGRGADTWQLDVIVLVSRRDDGLAQDDLDEYVNGFGAKSIRQAVFNDRTLGLPECDAVVTGMNGYGADFLLGATTYVGARLTVEVLTSGTA